jgi:probable HAF family extracellular repeat protein
MHRTHSHALALVLALGAAQAHAFDFKFTNLGSIDPYNESYAAKINNNNQVAGIVLNDYYEYGMNPGTPAIWSGPGGSSAQTLDTSLRYLYAINNAGQIAGGTMGANSYIQHAAILADGKTTQLPLPLGYRFTSYAADINDHGRAVGVASADQFYNNAHAVVWDRYGSFKDLHAVGGISYESTRALAINNSGDVVGIGNVNGLPRPVLWSGNTATELDMLKSANPIATPVSINDRGQAVGTSYVDRYEYITPHAAQWEDGKVIDLGTLGGYRSEATDINNSGHVVGWSDGKVMGQRATLWVHGQAVDLQAFAPDRRWQLMSATSINDQDVIVGYATHYGEDTNWTMRTNIFMLTPVAPVPEAETYAMMAAGFALFGLLRQRSQRTPSVTRSV